MTWDWNSSYPALQHCLHVSSGNALVPQTSVFQYPTGHCPPEFVSPLHISGTECNPPLSLPNEHIFAVRELRLPCINIVFYTSLNMSITAAFSAADCNSNVLLAERMHQIAHKAINSSTAAPQNGVRVIAEPLLSM